MCAALLTAKWKKKKKREKEWKKTVVACNKLSSPPISGMKLYLVPRFAEAAVITRPNFALVAFTGLHSSLVVCHYLVSTRIVSRSAWLSSVCTISNVRCLFWRIYKKIIFKTACFDRGKFRSLLCLFVEIVLQNKL